MVARSWRARGHWRAGHNRGRAAPCLRTCDATKVPVTRSHFYVPVTQSRFYVPVAQSRFYVPVAQSRFYVPVT